jgi:RHS repeat-associated protein
MRCSEGILVHSASATISAQYEYGPFGEVLRATGPMATVNPFRFSTKFQDDETGMLYYGYRYYDPSTGRWNSRDPFGERGGQNLQGFVRNSPTKRVDTNGGIDIEVEPICPQCHTRPNPLDANCRCTPRIPAPKCQSTVNERDRVVTVAKCEIMILFGHGFQGQPWSFNFESPCSAGGFAACYPGETNRRIQHPIPGVETHDEECVWLPEDPSHSLNNPWKTTIAMAWEDGFDLDIRHNLGTLIEGADKVAKELCKKKCCTEVIIRGHPFTPFAAGNKHVPPGFTISWNCTKKSGRFWSDDGKFNFPYNGSW